MSPSARRGSAMARPSAAYTATSVSDWPVQKTATAAEADRRVVGGLLPLALVAIDLDRVAARRERGRQQDVVDPEAPPAMEGARAVVPPGEETALLAVKPERVTESPTDEIAKRRALGVAEHDLAAPLLRVPHVAVLRGDVEVAAEHHRLVGLGGGLEEGAEAAIPVELVGVLVRADLLAVRPVDTHDREAGDTRHQKASLGVVALVREPSRDRLGAGARQDRHAVVGLLTGDQGRVAEPRELGERELVVGDLRLLEAHDVGPPPLEPREEARQPSPDRVHVPRRDLHGDDRSAGDRRSSRTAGPHARRRAPRSGIPAGRDAGVGLELSVEVAPLDAMPIRRERRVP